MVSLTPKSLHLIISIVHFLFYHYYQLLAHFAVLTKSDIQNDKKSWKLNESVKIVKFHTHLNEHELISFQKRFQT